MKEGPVSIVLRYKEPMSHDVLWLRPHLHGDGYDLLYYGSHGWLPLIDEHKPHHRGLRHGKPHPNDMAMLDMLKNYVEGEPLVPEKEDECSSQKMTIDE